MTDRKLEVIRPFFEAAALLAQRATCSRARCGSVIIQNGQIIGRGFNHPAGDGAARRCNQEYDLSIKPRYDKTCCIHAEWQAIFEACKCHADKIAGSTLYFMRIDAQGGFTDAGEPYCTACSRLTLAAGIGYFALWNNGGADIYDAAAYNQASYRFYART